MQSRCTTRPRSEVETLWQLLHVYVQKELPTLMENNIRMVPLGRLHALPGQVQEDLRAAALVAKGRRAVIPTLVVPGSGLVKRAAEAEGLDRIFTAAGFEWRDPGCSMCVGMNGDLGQTGDRIASTSNRNFEGRQGKGVRTHLMSPAMVAAAAVTGTLTDVRTLPAGRT